VNAPTAAPEIVVAETPHALIIGRVGHHKMDSKRLCFMNPEGEPMSWYGCNDTLDKLRKRLTKHGLRVLDDGTVARADR
jgi:hypothetical protein